MRGKTVEAEKQGPWYDLDPRFSTTLIQQPLVTFSLSFDCQGEKSQDLCSHSIIIIVEKGLILGVDRFNGLYLSNTLKIKATFFLILPH